MSGVAPTVEEMAQAARAAVASGDWAAARTCFEALVEREPAPEALAGLGDTLWWLGRTGETIRYQEQAYAAFRRCGDPAQSAVMAVGLYLLYRVSLGNTAAARGWLARAARLAEEAGLGPLAGWVALLRAHDSDDAVAAERWSREACESAAGFGDPDLELCAISQLGASLLQQGRRAEGTALLDEAMAASLAGECRRPHTVVYTSCNMISACAETAEVSHALQWIRAADGFLSRYGSLHLYVHCRVYYGAVLFASGDWAGAERELRAALATGVSAEPALRAEASARFAELRLAQGRLEEAERLLEGLEEHVTSACVLAALALASGEPAAARRIALRRVRELDQHDRERPGAYRAGLAVCLEAGKLWELLAEASSGPEAAAAVAHLTDLAERTGSRHLEARGLRAATSFRDACAQPGLSLPEVARMVDRSVTRAAGDEDFVTAVFAELDPRGWVQLVICGHPPPLRLNVSGKLESLAPAVFATPLGLRPVLYLLTFSVRTGDRLIFFTDGLLEARDRAGRFFRLAEHIQTLRRPALQAAADELMDHLRAHSRNRLDDDVAVLLVELTLTSPGPGPAPAASEGSPDLDGLA